MESTRSGVTFNQLARETISKPFGGNVKGDGDQSGIELRKVSRNWSELHSF